MSNPAQQHKEQGNKLFKLLKFDEAIEEYGLAILKNNAEPAYFTNRALCYMQVKRWQLAADDCRRALALDARNVKANYFLGKCAYHKGQLEEAIVLLTKAHEAAYAQKLVFGDEITSVLRQARRDKFRIEEDVRLSREIELQTYLNELIERDADARIAAMLQCVFQDDTAKAAGDADIESQMNEIKSEGAAKKEELNAMFAEIDDRRRRRDLPDYLCGKISFELLKDPVITPSGITYDRADIREHLQRVGRFDPITREPLEQSQLIPNLALKEVLDTFICENEWAVDV